MTNVKKKFVLGLALMFQFGFSQRITLEKVNEPANKFFKKELKAVLKNSLNKTLVEEDATYFYERRIESRKIVFDSLNILKNNKIIIIDYQEDRNGRTVDGTYIFCNDKIYLAGHKENTAIKNGKLYIDYKRYIIEVTLEELKKRNHNLDIISAYEHFDTMPYSKIKDGFKYCVLSRGYYITLINNNRVNYYVSKPFKKCKVLKYQ